MNNIEFINIVKESKSKSEVCQKIGKPINGSGIRFVTAKIKELDINCQHFDLYASKRKYLIVKKSCPVCDKVFETRKGHKKEKTVCSYACANTLFRSGKNNPNYKHFGTSRSYRKLVTLTACSICGYASEPRVLEVHHIDRNRKNNELTNLQVLCPLCHRLEHLNE